MLSNSGVSRIRGQKNNVFSFCRHSFVQISPLSLQGVSEEEIYRTVLIVRQFDINGSIVLPGQRVSMLKNIL